MPLIRACDTCFRQKIQCLRPDHRPVPCNWCSHHNLRCTITREETRRSKRRNNREDRLLDRIRQLEQALAESYMPQHLDDIETPRRLDSVTCPLHEGVFVDKDDSKAPSCEDDGIHPHIVVANRLFTQNWYHRGFPIVSEKGLKWIPSITHMDIARLDPYWLRTASDGIYICDFRQDFEDMPPPNRVWDLPEKSEVQSWLASLPGSSFQILFPALDKVLFEETIEAAYQVRSLLEYPETLSARACLWATFAIAALLKASGHFGMFVSREMCAERAHYFLRFYLELENSPNDIHVVQALFLLHKYRVAIGHYKTSTCMLSTACTRVDRLGGHLHRPMDRGGNAEPSLLERQQDHLRKLFWLCYTDSKDLNFPSGMRTRRSEGSDLSDPDRHLGHDVFLQVPGDVIDVEIMNSMTRDRVLDFLPGDPHLGLLKDKIEELLYSSSALEIIDSELLARIRQLDEELESWRVSVPPALRPKLSVTPLKGVLWNHTFPSYLRSVQLQLEYHYLLTVIHTPVRRFGATQGENSTLPEELHRAMHSSIDISLEASRATLRLLKEPMAMVKQETFWRSTSYPIVAAMSLFLNILIHPYSGRSGADMASILSASQVVDKLRKQCVTEYENRNIEQTAEFLKELAIHANGAILLGMGPNE